MVFHTRRTDHAASPPATDTFYWVPELDDNTAATLRDLDGPLAAARPVPAAECAARLWCGAPYYLPVRTLVPRALAAPAAEPPLAALRVQLRPRRLDDRTMEVELVANGTQHVVVVAAPARGAALAGAGAAGAPLAAPLEAPRWGERRVYFFALHDARAPRPFTLTLRIQRAAAAPPGAEWAALSVAGHALFGPARAAPAHARLLAALPDTTAPTGWGADLHLYTV